MPKVRIPKSDIFFRREVRALGWGIRVISKLVYPLPSRYEMRLDQPITPSMEQTARVLVEGIGKSIRNDSHRDVKRVHLQEKKKLLILDVRNRPITLAGH